MPYLKENLKRRTISHKYRPMLPSVFLQSWSCIITPIHFTFFTHKKRYNIEASCWSVETTSWCSHVHMYEVVLLHTDSSQRSPYDNTFDFFFKPCFFSFLQTQNTNYATDLKWFYFANGLGSSYYLPWVEGPMTPSRD